MAGMDQVGTEFIEGAGREFTEKDEAEVAELASELLEIHTDKELDRFLGRLLTGGRQAVAGLLPTPVGGALGAVLKSIVKRALSSVGTAADTMAVRRTERVTDGEVGNLAFEVARQFVDLAGKAAASAAQAPPHGTPLQTAQSAVIAAAKNSVSGSMRPDYHYPRSGKWVRRGNAIALLGAR